MKKFNIGLIALISVLFLHGCAGSKAGNVYSREQARQVQEVQYGWIVDLREVMIEGTSSGVGTLAGAGIGGVAGSSVGGGRGSAIAAIAGAVVGGIVGSAIEESGTHKAAWEITVKLDGGKTIAVVQEQTQDEAFGVGMRVRLLTNGWETRVSSAAPPPPRPAVPAGGAYH